MMVAAISITPHNSNRVWINKNCASPRVVEMFNSLCIWGGCDHIDETDMSWEFATHVDLINVVEQLGFTADIV